MIDDTNMTYIVEEAETSRDMSIELMILGTVITIVGIFGCVGNVKDSFCMCVTWAIFLLILMIVQAAVTSTVYYSKDEFLEVMDKVIENVFKKRASYSDNMDELQTLYTCCGVRGPIDYKESAYYGFFPITCCDKQFVDSENYCSEATLYKVGCRATYHQWWDLKYEQIVFGGMVIGAIELGGVFSAIWMAINIKIIERRGFTKSKKNKK